MIMIHSPPAARRLCRGLPTLGGQMGALPDWPGFVAMRQACESTGGLLRGDEVAGLLQGRQRGDFVALARLIVAGSVFGFDWSDAFWIPMFQFVPHDLSLDPGPQQVVAELTPVYTGWALAAWFVRPNAWLAERRPVDVLASDLPRVTEAARVERFMATA